MERRAVLHIDMDCFYAQVEHNRLNIPREEPLAVVQWEGLIAVNYPARAAGITRHDRAAVALQKCPKIRLAHVEYSLRSRSLFSRQSFARYLVAKGVAGAGTLERGVRRMPRTLSGEGARHRPALRSSRAPSR